MALGEMDSGSSLPNQEGRRLVSRRDVVRGAAALTGFLGMFGGGGCAGGQAGESVPAVGAKEVTLRWTTWGNQSSPMVEASTKGAALFTQKFPKIKPFVLAQWGTLDFNADIVLRPKGPSPRFHRWYTDAYAMWTASKVKDAAWEFMAYAGTDGQKDVENAGGRSIPGYKPVAETVFVQRKTLNINKQRWLDAAKEAKQQPLVKQWDEMNAVVSKYRNDLLDQKIAAREAAQGIEREVNTLLAQG
jgi:hypothetical protein